MKGFVRGVLSSVLLVGALVPAAAADGGDERSGWFYDGGLRFTAPEGNFELKINNLFQARYRAFDPDGDTDSLSSFDLARYKLRLTGDFLDNWSFRFQTNLSDGSEESTNLLEDAFVVFKKHHMAQLWVGQGKTFFGRQQLTESSNTQFIDRNFVTRRFAPGRDVGLALLGRNRRGTYEYQVGVYNGDGINKDAGDNNDYMVIGRLAVMPLGSMSLSETDRAREKKNRLSIGVAAMTDTAGTESFEEVRTSRGALELAYRYGGYNLQTEFFTESVDPLLAPVGEEVDTDGWYVQTGYLFKIGLEIAGLYSTILPEGPQNDIREYGLAFNYYFSKHNHKLQVDFLDLTFQGPDASPRIDARVVRVQLQFEL